MTQVDLSSYKKLYLQTAKEYVESLLINCSKLVSDLQDKSSTFLSQSNDANLYSKQQGSEKVLDKEAINQIHIDSHSLKSQSQVMGFADIAERCANIENISNDILNGAVKIDNKFPILLKNSVDEINSQLVRIEKEMLK